MTPPDAPPPGAAFVLSVDATRWRAHQDGVATDTPHLVPVVKGGGYGFSDPVLAGEAARLGVDTVAVGTAGEVAAVAERFGGDILVLAPWDPRLGPQPVVDGSVLTTVASAGAARAAQGRVVVELLTSMRRHGVPAGQVGTLADLDTAGLAGVALHLPLDVGPDQRVAEVLEHRARLAAVGLAALPVWVSHLGPAELVRVAAQDPGVLVRPRVGTRLWLGDAGAYGARAQVLDHHPVRRGDRAGYRQHRAPGPGHLVVLGGGTAHGLGLAAPAAPRGLPARARTAATGGLETLGWALSPFRVGGRRRWFVEPPHMHVSLVWLPASVPPPPVGSWVDATVRMTVARFDAVVLGPVG